MRSFCVLLLICLPFVATQPACAQEDAIKRAALALETAAEALSGARSGQARLVALGRATQAYEVALAAYRDGLRQMATRQDALTLQIAADRTRIERLLSAIQSLSQAPSSALLVYPGGPVQAMRGARLMGDIKPELDARIADVQGKLQALSAVRAQQNAARLEARSALAALQELRGDTAAALKSRREGALTTRAELRSQADIAAEQAAGLQDLAARLATAELPGSPPIVSFSEARGLIPAPVTGRIVGRYGEPDPWGRPGFGITFQAPAYAQIRSPWDGTVRYAGPLIDYDLVVIIEPEEGTLIILAGLRHTDLIVGESVLQGEPLGDLGGPIPQSEDFLVEATTDRDAIGTEKIYMELRVDGEAVDPLPWFDLTGG